LPESFEKVGRGDVFVNTHRAITVYVKLNYYGKQGVYMGIYRVK